MAASLPSSARRWKYDVFLSFRGTDTRRGITFEIYDRLHRRGIKTFKDDPDLGIGDAISPSLLRAIEESRFAIIVLSPNYGSSSWCLEELRKICECMEDESRIFPLFYNVEPTEVRYQKRSFKEAFTVHEKYKGSEKVQQWRNALKMVASFSGWDSKNYKTDRELVEDIVQYVYKRVQPIEINAGDFEEFEATAQAMNKVMKGLKDECVTAIAVYGMGGVGKTSLIKHVAAKCRKSGIFDHVIMAVVSQSPDLTKIQRTLADLLGVKLEEATEIGRAARLNMEIMRRERILIILDDVWKRIDLLSIGIPSFNELRNRNSKVLVTTRIRNVCHAMNCQEKISLNILSEQDSLTLFARNAGRSFESTNFQNVAGRVAGECCGLPIALIAVARALGDKDLVEWEKAAQRLEKSQTANPDDNGDVFECIKLSYDYVKDENSKSCFLLCCLFPEDYDIPIQDLFTYAIGKGLFHDANTDLCEARESADSVVKYLTDSSLLLASELEGHVRMHDVIRDTAMNIAKSEDGHGFLVIAGSDLEYWPCRLHEGYSAISLMGSELFELPEELVCPNLQILLLNQNLDLTDIPENFIQSLNELRVLNLSYTSIGLLPQSFSLLTNLQALCLDFCTALNDMSSLRELIKLEILRMREFQFHNYELPRAIEHLTNLRLLDVSCGMEGNIFTIPAGVISKLWRLEELYMLNCGFEDWGSQVEGGEEANIGFDELTCLSLNILQVCISDAKFIPENVQGEPNWDYFDIHIGPGKRKFDYNEPHHTSRSLELVDTIIDSLPDWFLNVVSTKTEKLHFHGSKGFSNFQDGQMFENLEELHLNNLDCLEELPVGDLPPGYLIHVKVLDVYRCSNLGNVSKLLQGLPNLEKLYLVDILRKEYVFGCEGFELEQSKLREMCLVSLHGVRSICNGPAQLAMFQSLISLVIYRCESLLSLFTSDVAQCLFQLEDLFVEQCPLLETVIEASKEIVNSKKKIVLPKVKNLVLKTLPMLSGVSATIDIECPSLEHLYVKKCPKFSFSTSASDHFHSRNQVQFNVEQQYDFLDQRWKRVTPYSIF